MAINVACRCSAKYSLKDEFAGKEVTCRNCGAALAVPARVRQSDPVFDRDLFLLNQRLLSVSEKYVINDGEGNPILFALRPRYFFRNLIALVAALPAFFVSVIVGAFIASAFAAPKIEALKILGAVLGFLTVFILPIFVMVILSKKRELFLFSDEARTNKVLEAVPYSRWMPINIRFSIRDAAGTPLGHFHKKIFSDFLRKRWRLFDASGRLICMAQEDSIILAVLRRFLGSFYGIIPMHFVLLDENHSKLGVVSRRLTVLDRYVLDLSADGQRRLDRRLAVIFGVFLDTGERR